MPRTNTVDVSRCLTVADVRRMIKFANPSDPVIISIRGGNAYATRIADQSSIALLQSDGSWKRVDGFIIEGGNART